MGKEASLERRAMLYARQQNILFYKFVSPGRRGVPDRLLIGPDGKMAFLEFKSPVGELSDLQKRELKILEDRKVRVYWVSDYPSAKAVIDSCIEDPEPTVRTALRPHPSLRDTQIMASHTHANWNKTFGPR